VLGSRLMMARPLPGLANTTTASAPLFAYEQYFDNAVALGSSGVNSPQTEYDAAVGTTFLGVEGVLQKRDALVPFLPSDVAAKWA
jgi:hypothetical protein